MVAERSTIALEDRWNVDDLYPSLEKWEEALKNCYAATKPHWPAIQQYKGKLGNPHDLKALLETTFSIEKVLSRLYTYAHLRQDEETTIDCNKSAYGKISSLLYLFQEETSWIDPELLSLDQSTIDRLLAAPELEPYRFHLEKTLRIKKHMLSPEMEALMAQAGKSFQATERAFRNLNDADFKFGFVLDGQGQKRELTHGEYGNYIRDQDRVLRKNCFQSMMGKYTRYENTLCELLNGQVQVHVFNSRARGYASSLDAALFPQNIDTSVYHALITAVNENISVLHDYCRLRKKALGLDALHLYDMNVPLTKDIDIHMPYKEAEDLIIESVAPLGDEYQNLLKKGLQSDRWVDRYENKNKRSGAYSSGSYDSMPYILMNYKGQIRDVFTLAHEAGHSMHSLFTHKNQPYQYGNYSIFVAEVASTFNEELLMKLLLKRAKNDEEKIFLLNQKVEDIRATLLRQTMFAEFELLIHTWAEKDIPLTPTLLKQEYRKLNEKYFGPDLIIDSEIDIEWARIPHFYYNFYVYQYATGISAALALADQVTHGGEKEREQYLTFLKTGSSKYPIETLQIAGIDMKKPAPVKAALNLMATLQKELEKLLYRK